MSQLTKELEEIQDNVDTYDPSIQKIIAQKYEHMTIFDPNHPRNQSYHAAKAKAIHDQKLQNSINRGLPVFKENQQDLLALPQPMGMTSGSSLSQASSIPKRKITIGTGNNYSDYIFKDVDLDDRKSIGNSSTDSKLRKTAQRSLERMKNASVKNHEFSVIIGGDDDLE